VAINVVRIGGYVLEYGHYNAIGALLLPFLEVIAGIWLVHDSMPPGEMVVVSMPPGWLLRFFPRGGGRARLEEVTNGGVNSKLLEFLDRGAGLFVRTVLDNSAGMYKMYS